MKGIERCLILHPQKDEQATGEAGRQARDVDKGIDLIAKQVTQGDQGVVLEHSESWLGKRMIWAPRRW